MDDNPPAPSPRTEAEAEDRADADEQTSLATGDDPTGRLGSYLARTQNGLDLLALLTLWVVVAPLADLENTHGLREFGLEVRVVLSVIYGIDMAIRTTLATRHWHYLRTHPLGVLAVIVPPVRVLFSLRLIRVVFRRGNLDRFLVAAFVLLANGALIVFLYERDAPGANIVSLGSSVWWSMVTVTTVGYGDLYPVTVPGRVVACFIMFIGIVTGAVITAQVSSSFIDQVARRKADAAVPAAPDRVSAASSAEGMQPTSSVAADAEDRAAVGGLAPTPPGAPSAVTLEQLDARLAQIERLLLSLQQPTSGGSGAASAG